VSFHRFASWCPRAGSPIDAIGIDSAIELFNASRSHVVAGLNDLILPAKMRNLNSRRCFVVLMLLLLLLDTR